MAALYAMGEVRGFAATFAVRAFVALLAVAAEHAIGAVHASGAANAANIGLGVGVLAGETVQLGEEVVFGHGLSFLFSGVFTGVVAGFCSFGLVTELPFPSSVIWLSAPASSASRPWMSVAARAFSISASVASVS